MLWHRSLHQRGCFQVGVTHIHYNLDDQVQKQYQDMCQDGDNTLCCHYHTEYTDDLDPPDAGAGNQIRFWLGFYLDEWLWE